MRRICVIVVLCLSLAGAAAGSAEVRLSAIHSQSQSGAKHAGSRTTSLICGAWSLGAGRPMRVGAASVLIGDRRVEPVLGQAPAGVAQAFPFGSRLRGKVTSIDVYLDRKSTAKRLTVALYSNKRCRPGRRMAIGSVGRLRAGGWNDVAVRRSAIIRAGQAYWLVILGHDGTLRFRYQGAAPCKSVSSGQTSLTMQPIAWSSGRVRSECSISAYATGTPVTITHGVLASPPSTSSAPIGASPAATPTGGDTGGGTLGALTTPPANTAPPVVTGTAISGETLTTSKGSWSGASVSYAYQWDDCDSSGNSCVVNPIAVSASYTLSSGDIGHTVRSIVTAINIAGTASAASAPTAVVLATAPSAPTNTARPTISGTPQVGRTLTATTGTWTNSPTSYTYQWQDCNSSGTNCANISGARANSYVVASSDAGDTIDVVVAATNAGGSASATSAPTSIVQGQSNGAAPSNSAPPTITGTAQVGSTLTATTGTWTNTPTSYSYQWFDCAQAGGNCIAVGGATSSSYTLGSTDTGDTVTVRVTATNASGSGGATSSTTQTIANTSYRTFYISYSSGNDANNGTSESGAWKLAPGMVGFAGSYSHQSGDHFIFEGGATWPNSAFPLAVGASGSSGQNDYYGVNPTWYIGASFSQPAFNANSQNITGADRNASGTQDVFVDLRNRDYVTVDDIAFENFVASGLTSPYGSCAAIEMVGDQNITINRVSIPNMSVDATTFHGPNCFGVQASTGAPYAGNSIVENSYISGALNSYATGILCVGNVENNTVDRMIGEVYPCGHGTISGNLLENCGNPFPAGSSGIHADAIQSDNANGTYYIHDNVIHDTGADQSAPNECESMLIGNPGETDYVWNNVLYNINGNPISLTQNSSPGVAAYIWNNSIQGGFKGSAYCVRSGHPATWTTIVIENNFCASSSSSATDPGLSASSMTVDHNVLLTPSQANTDGYGSTSSSFPYRPPSSTSVPTQGAATNLSSNCSGNLTPLCTTTNFAAQLGQASRPNSGAWNAGAY